MSKNGGDDESYDENNRSSYDEVVDELYGLTPDVFVRRRNEIVKDFRSGGERALAKRISLLRRPTRPAWALNQWVRQNPDESEAIVRLAADLTAAQRRSAADKIRTLSRRRQELVAAVTDAVAGTAADLGVTLSDSAVREVAQTVRAAIADSDTANRLRRGNLVTAEEYSGFGPAGVFVVPDVSSEDDEDELDEESSVDDEASDDADADPESGEDSGGEDSDGEDSDGEDSDDEDSDDEDSDDEGEDGEGEDDEDDADSAEESDRQTELEARLGEAEDDEQAAREHLAEVASSVDSASEEVDELVARSRELRDQLSRCEEELRFARQRLATAERERTEAKSAVRKAVAATNEVRLELADL